MRSTQLPPSPSSRSSAATGRQSANPTGAGGEERRSSRPKSGAELSAEDDAAVIPSAELEDRAGWQPRQPGPQGGKGSETERFRRPRNCLPLVDIAARLETATAICADRSGKTKFDASRPWKWPPSRSVVEVIARP